jgi:hypothetical protein
MRKWRPSFKCIYLIPEVRGNIDSLEVILNRVLPLRKFKGQEDCLIMLGGYSDADEHVHKVIDTLISLKEEYGDRVVFLRGDHEEMMLRSITGSERDYTYWLENGGAITLEGYLKRSGLKPGASSFPHNRLRDVIPVEHVKFLQSLPFFYETEDFFFIHGGFNPKLPLKDNNPITFAFDTVSNRLYKSAWGKEGEISVEKVIVAAHNSGKAPVIYPRYFMLGGTAPKKLIVMDLNSMEFCAAKRGKSRIYKTNIMIME